MTDKIIIGIVVLVVVIAHVLLFRWIKFKMDEGIILKLLRDASGDKPFGTETISDTAKISMGRVSYVCNKSQFIIQHAGERGYWRIGE